MRGGYIACPVGLDGEQRVLGPLENAGHGIPFAAGDESILIRVDVNKMPAGGPVWCFIARQSAIVIDVSLLQQRVELWQPA
jgi:hypothetical protein